MGLAAPIPADDETLALLRAIDVRLARLEATVDAALHAAPFWFRVKVKGGSSDGQTR